MVEFLITGAAIWIHGVYMEYICDRLPWVGLNTAVQCRKARTARIAGIAIILVVPSQMIM